MEPGKPGRGAARAPGRRKYRRTLPCRSRYSLTYFSLSRVMASSSNAIPAIRSVPRKRVERQINGANIPDLATIDSDGCRHPAIRDEFIEFCSRDTDVHG